MVGNASAASRQSFGEVVERPTGPSNSEAEQVTDWFTIASHGAGFSPAAPVAPLKRKLGLAENKGAPVSARANEIVPSAARTASRLPWVVFAPPAVG